MTDEQAGQYTGSIPQAYRNALFWRWAPEMPRRLPAAFVTLLYALGTAADASGRLRFRDGKVIRIRDIAAAVKADEKDVRRYLNAALAAGILTIEGERGRGKAALYVLVISPRPDWDAALASLDATRRKPRKAPPWMEEKNGGHAPELPETENGAHAPELSTGDDQGERGTRPRMGSGDTPPNSSGDTPPNNPWGTQRVPQEIADVGDQPQEPPGRASPQDHSQEHGRFARCKACGNPVITLAGQSPRDYCRNCERTHSPGKTSLRTP